MSSESSLASSARGAICSRARAIRTAMKENPNRAKSVFCRTRGEKGSSGTRARSASTSDPPTRASCAASPRRLSRRPATSPGLPRPWKRAMRASSLWRVAVSDCRAVATRYARNVCATVLAVRTAPAASSSSAAMRRRLASVDADALTVFDRASADVPRRFAATASTGRALTRRSSVSSSRATSSASAPLAATPSSLSTIVADARYVAGSRRDTAATTAVSGTTIASISSQLRRSDWRYRRGSTASSERAVPAAAAEYGSMCRNL